MKAAPRLEGPAAVRLHELANTVDRAVLVAGELDELPELRQRLEQALRLVNRALAREGRLVCGCCGRRSDDDVDLDGWAFGWRARRRGDDVAILCGRCDLDGWA